LSFYSYIDYKRQNVTPPMQLLTCINASRVHSGWLLHTYFKICGEMQKTAKHIYGNVWNSRLDNNHVESALRRNTTNKFKISQIFMFLICYLFDFHIFTYCIKKGVSTTLTPCLSKRFRMGLRLVASRPFDRAVAVAAGGATGKAREKTMVKAHICKNPNLSAGIWRFRMGLNQRPPD
jgi:hypothetical protein